MNRRCASLAVLACAWVLWEEVESSRGSGRELTMKAADAAETRADCHALLGKRLDEVAGRPSIEGWKRSRTPREFIEVNNTGTISLRVRLTCLPAETDPRPRVKE